MKGKIVTVDVRDDIRSGRSPLSAVLKVVATLLPDETLRVLAPFEPAPLYELLGRQGFQQAAKLIAGSDWEVLFTRKPGTAPPPARPTGVPASNCGYSDNNPKNAVEVDARGLEPPQPMVKMLEAVAGLPSGALLLAHTDRRPMHLYAQLEDRGFTGESQEQSDGSFITHIRHR
ncbi:MAG: DUF2249 domain-containing protein [Verrucomicrobiota bacterium]|nr:DUF2249 domain-containing protein [Verrucomicrobiota bacterium]MCC6820566.1 DUF2249 domain-containing protein [Limisphaerales bacterium]